MTSTAKHTPGPWMLHDMEFATVVTKEKLGQYIAVCDAATLSDWENLANARLIAAAPQLLEALKWMMATRRNADSEAGLEAENLSSAAVKAATDEMTTQ